MGLQLRALPLFNFGAGSRMFKVESEPNTSPIRQYLPKTEGMARLTQQRCNQIADKLNRRPRKRYAYKTPEEMYYGI